MDQGTGRPVSRRKASMRDDDRWSVYSSDSSSESASASHLMKGSDALRTFFDTSLATYWQRGATRGQRREQGSKDQTQRAKSAIRQDPAPGVILGRRGENLTFFETWVPHCVSTSSSRTSAW